MPFSPSDLPWWGWLLCSLAAWIVTIISGGLGSVASETKDKAGLGCLGLVIAVLSGLVAAATGIMGIVLFVKWVWYS